MSLTSNGQNWLMKDTRRALSILVGIFSLVSLIQQLFNVGVFEVAREALGFYRTIAYFFLGFPARLFGYSFPHVFMDYWALSFIGAAAYVKANNIEGTRFFRYYKNLTSIPYWKLWLFLVFGLTGIGIIVLLSAISPTTYGDEFHEEPPVVMRDAAYNALAIFGGAIVFFALNAFAPTV